MADFYLKHGASFARDSENTQGRGPMGLCYQNAGSLALSDDRFTYCEGFAQRAGLFPMHHAWCLDEQGQVVDPTWEFNAQDRYFGVAISHDFLMDVINEANQWGVLADYISPMVIDTLKDPEVAPHWLVQPVNNSAKKLAP